MDSVEQARPPACSPPPSALDLEEPGWQARYFFELPLPVGPWRAGALTTLVPEPDRVTAAAVCLYTGDGPRPRTILRADQTLTLGTDDARSLARTYNDNAITKLPPGNGLAFVARGWLTTTVFAYDEGPTTSVTRSPSTAVTNGKYRGYLLNTPMDTTPAPQTNTPTPTNS